MSGGELSRSRGPRARMQTAPRGAVMRIESTARVRISEPIGSHSFLPCLMQLSRKTGPRAAEIKDILSVNRRNMKMNVFMYYSRNVVDSILLFTLHFGE